MYLIFDNITGQRRDQVLFGKILRLPRKSLLIITSALICGLIGSQLAFATHTFAVISSTPTAPKSLKSTAMTSRSVTLSWTASTGASKLAGYQIYRNSNLFGTVSNTTTSYVDTVAMPQSTYQYAVKGYYGTSVTQSTNTITVTTPTVTPPARIAATGTPLTGCTEITTPGNYYLANDVNANVSVCFKIHDTSNVTFNCDGHAIAQSLDEPVVIQNVTGFTVANCNIPKGAFIVETSTNGLIQANTFAGGALVDVTSTQNIATQFNTFNFAQYEQDSATNNYVGFNTFGPPTNDVGVLISNTGSNNVIEYNVITGNGSQDGSNLGTDDAISVNGENSDFVRANTVSTVFDCGIATRGLISNSTFVGNKVTKARNCGLGGWFWSSWHGNTVTDNVFDHATNMFYFSRWYGLQPNEQYMYFDHNSFSYNVLTNKVQTSTPEAQLDLLSHTSIPTSQMVIGNNVFSGNNFGRAGLPPYMKPASLAIDGGGNICSTKAPITKGSNPLNCH